MDEWKKFHGIKMNEIGKLFTFVKSINFNLKTFYGRFEMLHFSFDFRLKRLSLKMSPFHFF